MRLSDYLQGVIQNAISKSFGECEIILFGSRTDDSKKGGDFDIAVKCNLSQREFQRAKVQFVKELILQDLDLPIDLISYNHARDSFRKEIDRSGIELSPRKHSTVS